MATLPLSGVGAKSKRVSGNDAVERLGVRSMSRRELLLRELNLLNRVSF